MKLLKNAIIAGTLAFATLNVASAAPILNISSSGSTLLGASGVNVGGTLYDVSFADGILDASAITAFTTATGAQAASLALLEQVLVGRWDIQPDSTEGCSFSSECYITTPYFFDGSFLSSYISRNYDLESRDDVIQEDTPRGTDTGAPFSTIARWTPIAAVPEPETYAMMFAGLGLLGFVSRRRKQNAAV